MKQKNSPSKLSVIESPLTIFICPICRSNYTSKELALSCLNTLADIPKFQIGDSVSLPSFSQSEGYIRLHRIVTDITYRNPHHQTTPLYILDNLDDDPHSEKTLQLHRRKDNLSHEHYLLTVQQNKISELVFRSEILWHPRQGIYKLEVWTV